MPLVREVAESIKLLGDVVTSTRDIVKAVNDGKEYLKRYYPDAQSDLSSLLQQMQRTIVGLANVTDVMSGFRFVVAGTSVDLDIASRDLRKLNDYLIAQRAKTAELRGHIHELKANCSKVYTLRGQLDARTKTKTWGSMFELLGAKKLERSLELHAVVSSFYADDQRMIELVENTLQLTEKAVAEVEDCLGPPGMMNPYNVPNAAEVLGLYAKLFRAPHDELQGLANDLHDASMALAP
jgi:hypothetical protein